MKPIFAIIVLLALTLAFQASAKPVPKLPPKDDKAKLDAVEKLIAGKWQGVSAVAQGDKSMFNAVWRINGGRIANVQQDGNSNGIKYHLVSPGPPLQIDLMWSSGFRANKILRGIIKVEQDTLTVCFVSGTQDNAEQLPRPQNFGVPAERDHITLVFQRVAPPGNEP